MSAQGLLRFGRYAFPPNRLGYCGSEDHAALLERVSEGATGRGLLELARRFEGAYPYLCLIAQANGIGDPFDEQVVDAYWVGNRLLASVKPAPFYQTLEARFAKQLKRAEIAWLGRKLELAARPHHSFHVFDIYVRAGLMRNPQAAVALGTMDSCRVSWGRVKLVEGQDLVVERPPLGLEAGKLSLSRPELVRVAWQLGGKGFVGGVQVGDWVSMHWDWACEVLNADALARLRRATRRSLEVANVTV
jgi:hypothetical protein